MISSKPHRLAPPVRESESENAAEGAAAQIDTKTSHDAQGVRSRTPSSKIWAMDCRGEAVKLPVRDVKASVADARQPSGSVPGGQGGNVKF